MTSTIDVKIAAVAKAILFADAPSATLSNEWSIVTIGSKFVKIGTKPFIYALFEQLTSIIDVKIAAVSKAILFAGAPSATLSNEWSIVTIGSEFVKI